MIDIGARIKQLREERHLTGKDLAERIGLSPSQMTRLEKGQRRVDSEVILRLAAALDLPPAAFFGSGDEAQDQGLATKRAKELGLGHLHGDVGRLIRSERRRRHITVDDLARRTGYSRAYVLAVEQGRRSGLDGDFLRKAARILQIDPFRILEHQETIIRTLGARVRRLATSTPGAAGEGKEGIPILIGDEAPYPIEFTPDGDPAAAVEGTLVIPELLGQKAFALRVRGEEMTGEVFSEGDLVVFTGERAAESGECAFVRLRGGRSTFCRLFQDRGKALRMQFLRSEVPPEIMSPDELVRAWPLIAHVLVRDPRR